MLDTKSAVLGSVMWGIAVAGCGSSESPLFANGADGGENGAGGANGADGRAGTAPTLGGGAAARTCGDPNAGDLQGCACTQQQRACFTGDPNLRNRTGCHDGTQTCTKSGEFSQWGPCTGDVASCTPGVPGGSDSGSPGTRDEGIDAGRGTSVAGGSCTPGDVEEVPAGSHGCMGQGTPSEVLYCESDGTWKCFPAGSCSPQACAACLRANHCDSALSDSNLSAQCKDGLQKGYNWLAGCGPDRSAYFSQFGSACRGNELNSINVCKLTNCIRSGGQDGPCSVY
jgi:hypothetical protein